MTVNSSSEIKIQKGIDPKIIALICNWYSFEETDVINDIDLPLNIKIIRVMCTSRIDRAIILKAVKEKIDGIIIISCSREMCRYKGGNEMAINRIKKTASFLTNLGYDMNRIKFFEAEADVTTKSSLAEILTAFSDKIKKLGHFQ
ncbi:MAG: hydrogenase iron-sulfur subunit [Promethearchaeota archaeon]